LRPLLRLPPRGVAVNLHIGELQSSLDVDAEPARSEGTTSGTPKASEADGTRQLIESERMIRRDHLRTHARGYAD
jgi:hypothetical protein